MSRSQHLKNILGQAKEKEKKYNWLGAVEFYEKSSSFALRKKDFWKTGEIEERIGYCFHRAAFQAETQEEFKNRMQLAADFYEKGAELFEKAEETETRAEINHCKAMVAYVNSWLAADLSAKREQLDECWRLEKEALKAYEKAADHMNVGKTCNNLIIFLTDRLNIEWDAESREKIIEEALEYGEKATEIFSKARDRHQLAQAYSITAFFHRNAAFARRFKAERREECRKKALSYPQKAIEISEEIGDAYLIGSSNLCLADARLDILGSTGLQEKQHYEKALQCGFLTKDNLLIADALFGLQFATNFSAITQEDPDKAREEYRKLDKYWEDAVRHYSLVAHDSGIAMAYSQMIIPIEQRSRLETNLENKRPLLEKSVELGYRGLDHARLSGSIEVTCHITRALSVAIFCLARIETDTSRKRGLLNQSSRYIEQYIGALKQASAVSLVEPKEVNLAFVIWALAMNQVELANVEENVDGKIKMLESAITNMRSAREYWLKWVKSPRVRAEKPHWVVVGENEMKTGKTLNQLYELSRDSTFLGDGLEAFERSVGTYDKADLPSRVAEAYWQIAKTYNQLAEYSESAKNFESASKNYRLAAINIPHLKNFYSDYATYMQAWSEIEKAKLAHEREEYASSQERYNKAANYLQSSTLWNHLALNYSAWSLLEHAEHLSRQEKNQESIQVFQRAAEMLNEAKSSLETAWSKIVDPYEKEKVSELSRACDRRRKYCLGRVSVEKARVFEKVGDYESSAKRYGSAAKAFEKLMEGIEIKSHRRELQSIVYLCQAWQKMKLAEERLDPTLYAEASQLFMKAKESSLRKRTTLLATGNSCFCKALEFGVKFKDTRNMELYSKTKQFLESASDCYTEAGFKKESFWVNATQVLFDSYVYMSKAETEVDPEKKLRFYLLAERFLDRSANLFERAGYLRKRNEVLRSIEKVKQKREFMLSLREVLSAPSIASSTSSISAPAPTHEEAVGLERFEQAYVQANLIIRPKKVNVGEDLWLEIKLVNTGKEPASLVKIEEILPSGFEPVAKPDYCRFEDAYVDMKGKKLNPLKTEEIRLTLRSFDKGTFAIKPRIIYVDETGHQMSCEPKPATINVSEVVLPGRITTGYRDLDNLLFGGIPENYAVILTSPSCDEKDLLIKSFLETGVKKGEITFYVTIDASGVRALVEEFQSNFYLFICNPQADTIIKSLPNVFKLKGMENLTDISIALTSAFHRLDASLKGPRRACIEIISDVLLQHRAVSTRRWLTALIPNLRSRGFTTLAVINAQMHPPEEVQAILGLFKGEINIYEKENKKGLQKFLKIRKMYNQRYLESELSLRKEKLET